MLYQEPKKERSAYWDNIKGILILFVVFAHTLYQLQNQFSAVDQTVDYIYMFHMPAFVFVSGYFGKGEKACSFESLIKLLFLYFVFNSLVGFLYGFTSLLQPMYSYWYLIALFVWRLTAHYLARFQKILLILFAVALFSGFYPSIDNNFGASRILCFYPCYMMGYLLSREKSEALRKQAYRERAPFGAAALVIAAAFAVIAYQVFAYSDYALLMYPYDGQLDAFGRIFLYIIAFSAIYALRCLSPNRPLPLLTQIGRNSLWIYVIHRPLTLTLSDYLAELPCPVILLAAAVSAIGICYLFGNDQIAGYLNIFLAQGVGIFTGDNKKINAAKLAALAVSVGFIVSVVLNAYSGFSFGAGTETGNEAPGSSRENVESDVIYPILADSQKEQFDQAFRITFAGDLILLEDQVKRGYKDSAYDFSDVFEYAKPYIASADLAIGVFEGPMAGEAAGYSSSNYGDGKELYLNFPDAFATAVKEAGFDLVTTANNHLLDRGEAGALRTIDILDEVGLPHTGSYQSQEDKQQNRVKLIECQGVKMAVLSYTYGCNSIDNGELIDGRYSYLTSVISGTSGSQFEQLKQAVIADFQAAKALSPDLIVVLPHVGTQFLNDADAEQKVWFEIFKENGADIILGDHPHVVEPVTMEEYNGRMVYTAYCPGNFANIYRENQGDTSMLTEVYVDRNTKQVIGGSIVPLYTCASADGNYRAIPIYNIMNDAELRKKLTTDDIARAANANVVFGHKMDITSVTERYFFNENGFLRSKAPGLAFTENMKTGTLYQAMDQAEKICFIGDSVTEGTKNGGCPWYEPIEALFPQKEISRYAKGGCTVSYMIENVGAIPQADLYVIALGTNDVRYRNESTCAMTPEAYIGALNELKNKLLSASPKAKFVFIAPWYSTDGDPYCGMTYAEKTAMNEAYSAALEQSCAAQGEGFINANTYIRTALSTAPDRDYLLDHIHPNQSKGVTLYAEAVLLN